MNQKWKTLCREESTDILSWNHFLRFLSTVQPNRQICCLPVWDILGWLTTLWRRPCLGGISFPCGCRCSTIGSHTKGGAVLKQLNQLKQWGWIGYAKNEEASQAVCLPGASLKTTVFFSDQKESFCLVLGSLKRSHGTFTSRSVWGQRFASTSCATAERC